MVTVFFFLINSLAHWHTHILANNPKKKKRVRMFRGKNKQTNLHDEIQKQRENSDIEKQSKCITMHKEEEEK